MKPRWWWSRASKRRARRHEELVAAVATGDQGRVDAVQAAILADYRRAGMLEP